MEVPPQDPKAIVSAVDEIISLVGRTVENLRNLTYLTVHESENPECVRLYMEMADEQLQNLVDVLRKRGH
jgi:hypothetical protein